MEEFNPNEVKKDLDSDKESTFNEAVKKKRKLKEVFAVNEADMSLDKLTEQRARRL